MDPVKHPEIEIEIPKPTEVIQEQPTQPHVNTDVMQPLLSPVPEKPMETIHTVRPPVINPEFEGLSPEAIDLLNAVSYEQDGDIPTTKLWKKKDGSPLGINDKIAVRLTLLTTITDYLKINEVKKDYSDKIIRRGRRPTLSQTLESQSMRRMMQQKKKIEKKPRKDCACCLEKVEGEKRMKLLIFLREMIALNNDAKFDEVMQFAQSVVPTMQFDEIQMEEDNVDHGEQIMPEVQM